MTANGKRDWNEEPALKDLMADPVTQAVMARDGVVPGELIRLLRAARQRFDGGRHHA